MLLEVLLAAVHSPSFDCSRAGSMVETLICASGELSALDREEARLYGLAAAGSSAQRRRALSRQREFLKERNSCAERRSGETLVECVRDAYLGEVADLRRLYPQSSDRSALAEAPVRYRCDEGYPDAYVTRFRLTPAQAYITIPELNEGQPLLASADEPQRLVGRYSTGMILEPGGALLRLNARICTPARGDQATPAPNAAQEAETAAQAAREKKSVSLPVPKYTLTGKGLSSGLTFGLPKTRAVQLATAAFGAPTRRERIECPAGPMDFVSFGDLDLVFEDGRFTGWSLHGPQPPLRTSAGIGIGSPRSALGTSAISEDDGMGPGFDLGDFGGYLDQTGSRVASLAGGSICEFG